MIEATRVVQEMQTAAADYACFTNERLVADGLPALSEQQGLAAAYLGFQTTPAGLGTAATRIPATT